MTLNENSPESIVFESWSKVLIENSKINKGTLKELSTSGKLLRVIKPLLNEIETLRKSYQTERDQVDGRLMQHLKSALAYLSAFHLPNAVRLLSLLNRIDKDNRGLLSSTLGKHPCIYDFGCGTGALSSAFTAKLFSSSKDGSFSPKVFQYDTNRHLLTISAGIMEALEIPNLNHRQIRSSMDTLRVSNTSPRETDSSSVYLLGYIWNEIQKNKRSLKLLFDVFEKVSSQEKPGLIIVLEPATQNSWNTVKTLRNDIAQAGMEVLYPCPHSFNCPLSGKDRCYSEFEWQQPQIYQKLESLQKVYRSKLATSGFVFANRAFMQSSKDIIRPDRKVGFPKDKDPHSNQSSTIICKNDGTYEKIAHYSKSALRCEAH